MAHSHKNSNTHVFMSFNSFIEQTNISSLKRTEGYQALPEDEYASCFGSALTQYSEINCTDHFANFRREVEEYALSHELVILHKDNIANALLRHLLIPRSMALVELLDLVVQLSRDLQQDFYSLYFEKFYEILVKLIEVRHLDADVIKSIFRCLAFLIKSLFRPMLKDAKKIFRMICPLLSQEQSKDYVNIFAAEAFSFLVRKHKEPEELFEYIFKAVEKDENLSDGVGQLLFETVHGVQQQFHSCASKIIPVLLNSLEKVDYMDAKVSTLCMMWRLMSEYTTADHSGLILSFVIERLEKLCEDWKARKEEVGHQFSGILQLLNIWLKHKDGIFIKEHERLVAVIVFLTESERHIPADGISHLLLSCSSILTAKKQDLDAHLRARLLSAVFKSGYTYLELTDFIQSLLDLPNYDKEAKPFLVDYVSKLDVFTEALLIVNMELMHKLPNSTSVSDVVGAESCPFDFRGKEQLFVRQLVQSLDEISKGHELRNVKLSELWAMVRCLPHLRPMDAESCLEIVHRLFLKILNVTQTATATNEDVTLLLGILKQTTITLMNLVKSENKQLLCYLPQELPVTLLSQYAENEDSLMIVAIYFTCAENEDRLDLLSSDSFETVFGLLNNNLSSPYSQIRYLTLYILSRFKLSASVSAKENVDSRNVFEMCLDVELVPASFHRYRDKMMQMNKLSCEHISSRLPVGVSEKVPLDYLIGQLHLNFELIWKTLFQLIKSYASGMTLNSFWEVFEKHVTKAAEMAQSDAEVSPKEILSTDDSPLSPLFEKFCRFNPEQRINDRPNFSSFRDHLWMAMKRFPHVCEQRSRIVVPIFFNFLENEYRSIEVTSTRTQDLRLSSGNNDDDVDDDVDDEKRQHNDKRNNKEEAMETEEEAGEKGKGERKPGRKTSDRVLVFHLEVFQDFKDVMSLFQGKKLFDTYLELLKHPSPSVQENAFKCLLPYKLKYLTPYKDNFLRLISEKTFREEVVLFSINAESQVINPEHRADMIPILMRILYGKIKMKVGKDAGGRSQGQTRKNIVLSFLANSEPDEIHHFFDLTFKPFEQFFTDNLHEKVNEISTSVDVSKVIPLRKLQGVLSSIEMVMQRLRGIVELYLPKILQLLVGLGCYCSRLLALRTEIYPKCVNVIKSIRLSILARVSELFEHFDTYPWSVNEVDSLFQAIVWPQLEKLPITEGEKDAPVPYVFPKGLLRLCHLWSTNPRYFCLLVKCSPDPALLNVIPLPCILKLVDSENVDKSTKDLVMSIIENLLEVEEPMQDESEETEEIVPLDPGSMWKVPVKEGVSYGMSLVLLFAPCILNYLVRVIEDLAVDVGGKKRGAKNFTIPKVEIKILKCLAGHTTDAVLCRKIAGLSLDIVARMRFLDAEVENDLMMSALDMIGKVEVVNQLPELLKTIWNLFDRLTNVTSRVTLCRILSVLASKEPSLKDSAVIAEKLNAVSKTMLAEPDYDLRIEGYFEAKEFVRRPDVDKNLLLTLVHNCCFFISTSNDSSYSCLSEVIVKLAGIDSKSDTFKEVIVEHLLPRVKAKLQAKDKILREVFIEKLRLLVLSFPSYAHFDSLRCLVNEDDKEHDFFLNVVHVQVHRQHRALQDLTKVLQEKLMPTSVITSYLMPIVMAILRNDDDYLSQHVLRDFAMKALGAIARRLPWPYYYRTLTSCLKELLTGKQTLKINIRILVAILDSFHFDLRNSQLTESGINQGQSLATQSAKEAEVVAEVTETVDGEDGEETAMEVVENDVDSSADSEVIQICPVGRATHIHRVITLTILPQLYKCLNEKTKSDDEHKLAKLGNVAEDIEINRVPIAVAMISLLKVLPNSELSKNLSGILMKVIRFLQSRSELIRKAAYDTLRKIVTSLGPSYLKHVITEMKLMLTRGYQLHVLCYAIWNLLEEFKIQNQKNLEENKKPFMQPGDINSCVGALTEILNLELFGDIAEEKQVEGIVGKLMEAKRMRGVESYGLLTTFVSKETFPVLIASMKKILEETRSHKVVNVASNVLTAILGNVLENSTLDLPFLMEFAFAMTSDALKTFKSSEARESNPKEHDPRFQPKSCLLLKSELPRGGRKPKTDVKANIHALVEFGFLLLNKLLSRGKSSFDKKSHLRLLDPFVSPLADSLTNRDVKVTSAALQCLAKVFEFPVPSLKKHSSKIYDHLFVLLQNYAVVGRGQAANGNLVMWCFKAITALLKHQKNIQITADHLHTLLLYAEQDVNDFTRHATAFPLLKAIIGRKFKAKELPQIILHLEQMSIQQIPEVRSKCQEVILSYLMNHPLTSKELEKHIDFYVTQLSCDFSSGRQGAAEMLKDFFTHFPQNLVCMWKFKFFFPLLQVSVEDSLSREMMLSLMNQFLTRLDNPVRDELVTHCCTMMKNEQPGILVSGAVGVSCIVEVENESFKRHLSTVLPLIRSQLSPEKSHSINDVTYYYLDLMFKIITKCNVLRDPTYTKSLNRIWECVLGHLRHSSALIQVKAGQLFLKLFESWNAKELLEKSDNGQSKEFLRVNLDTKLYDLCGAFCHQFLAPEISEELAATVMLNLLFLGKVLLLRSKTALEEEEEEEDDAVDDVTDGQKKASFNWLIRRFNNEIKEEIRNRKNKSTIKRESVFSWIEGIFSQVNYSIVVPHLSFMLKPLVREQTDPETGVEMKQQVDRILGAIEKKASEAETDAEQTSFQKSYRIVHKKIMDRKGERKKAHEEMAKDAEKFAKMKVRKNLLSKESKKRKMKEKRSMKGVKRQRVC